MLKNISKLLIVIFALLSSACSVLETEVTNDARVEPKFSYVYGDFVLTGDAGSTTIALILEDDSEYPTYLNTRSEYQSTWRTRYRNKVKVGISGLFEDIEGMNTTFKYRSNPFSLREKARMRG